MFGRKQKIQDSGTVLAPDGLEAIEMSDVQSEATALTTLAKLFDVFQPGAIFSEPTTIKNGTGGDTTVITAAEVNVGMGLGFGRGSGGDEESNGEGGGGGGGGGAAGRPVAAIIISAQGVRVDPIVDVTKIMLAFFTMLGAIFMAGRAMRRQSRMARH